MQLATASLKHERDGHRAREITADVTPNGIYFAILRPEPYALASGIYQLGPHSEAPEASAYGSK